MTCDPDAPATLRNVGEAMTKLEEIKAKHSANGAGRHSNIGIADIDWLIAEVERLTNERQQKVLPFVGTVRRVLDEHSAWIARPNKEVEDAIAIACGVMVDLFADAERAKVAEIKQELASRSIPGRDRENIRALLAIVAELERDLKHVQESDVAMMELLNTARGERDCAFKNLEDRTSERNSFAASLCAERTKVAKLRETARIVRRTAELSSNIMRDIKRTGGWSGSERVARQFDRIALRLTETEDKP